MIFLDAIERQRTGNTNGNYFLKILQHLSDVVGEQRDDFSGFFWVDFFFLLERLYLFFVSFCFLVDDPSQLGRKVGKTGFIYPCLSRTCTRILDLMFVFLILVGSVDTFVRISDVEEKIFLMMFLVK
jgi:hypothetical protein